MKIPRLYLLGCCGVLLLSAAARPGFGADNDATAGSPPGAFRAGAAAVDITPKELPVIVSGSFLGRTAGKVHDPLFARCVVLDDGACRLAIVVVDTLMMPRELIDEAKRQAAVETGIPPGHIMVAATHTHSAPSVMGALGTGVDEPYARYLPGRIVDAIRQAAENLAPARVGWTSVRDPAHTHCRRWILRPDRLGTDPFGERTVRAMMHPGYQNPAYVGPAGPVDDGLSLLAVQSLQGRPIAVLANYSMHYFGSAAVSADYFGRFVREVAAKLEPDEAEPPLVAMMSQGTSGDLHWMDYSGPRKSIGIDSYAREVAEVALGAYRSIEFRDHAALGAAQRKLALRRRLPDAKRLAWAQGVAAEMAGRAPATRPEVYALEQIYLSEEPQREVTLQAMRVGELGITAIPCEVFGITGLKIKALSPLPTTFNLELANGGEGYIPPPEQHALGGYTTWPARSAALEVQAEPKIVEAVVSLLEEVSGHTRRRPSDARGEYARAVLASHPAAYWQLGEMAGPKAVDASGNGHDGTYEDGVALYLPGPNRGGLSADGRPSRAAHFAGGRMKAVWKDLGTVYSVEAWVSSGVPNDARPVTGYFFSRGEDGARDCPGDHLGIGGTHLENAAGKLIFFNGDRRDDVLVGNTVLAPRTWHHVALVRNGPRVTVYLDGNPRPEIDGEAAIDYEPETNGLFVGGRSDRFAGFEGKMDEVAVYGRALTPDEVASRYAAAGIESE